MRPLSTVEQHVDPPHTHIAAAPPPHAATHADDGGYGGGGAIKGHLVNSIAFEAHAGDSDVGHAGHFCGPMPATSAQLGGQRSWSIRS